MIIQELKSTPSREAQVEMCAPGFRLVQSRVLWLVWSWVDEWSLFACLCVCVVCVHRFVYMYIHIFALHNSLPYKQMKIKGLEDMRLNIYNWTIWDTHVLGRCGPCREIVNWYNGKTERWTLYNELTPS